MTIQTGIKRTCQSDIHHTNNAILEMAIADFFTAKTFLTEWLSPLDLSNCWKRQNMWEAISKYHTEKIGGKTNNFFVIFFLN